tara:strand:- start:35521 stop:36522 length:1002 start_codon:yes stop_codon:yes gene_type:complete
MIADVVLGLQHGDEAKGKVSYNLAKKSEYTHVVRFNGGANAGHTIYHEGEKHVTHHIPAGVFFNKKSLIGPGCVINIKSLIEEIVELEAKGINVLDNLQIAYNAHIVTDEHLEEDSTDTRIGTTRRGIGPCYTSKFARTGLQAKDVDDLFIKTFLVDPVLELNAHGVVALFEGAQGFGLDVDHGDYPFVTSSNVGIGAVLNTGIPPQSIRRVYGVAKIYETYVGAKQFEPQDDDLWGRIREVGEEYGATTGRPRQCNWLNWPNLVKAIIVNGVTDLVVNKVDVLRQVGKFGIIVNDSGRVMEFSSMRELQQFILDFKVPFVENITFSSSKEKI